MFAIRSEIATTDPALDAEQIIAAWIAVFQSESHASKRQCFRLVSRQSQPPNSIGSKRASLWIGDFHHHTLIHDLAVNPKPRVVACPVRQSTIHIVRDFKGDVARLARLNSKPRRRVVDVARQLSRSNRHAKGIRKV